MVPRPLGCEPTDEELVDAADWDDLIAAAPVAYADRLRFPCPECELTPRGTCGPGRPRPVTTHALRLAEGCLGLRRIERLECYGAVDDAVQRKAEQLAECMEWHGSVDADGGSWSCSWCGASGTVHALRRRALEHPDWLANLRDALAEAA